MHVKPAESFDPTEAARILLDLMKALALPVFVTAEQEGKTDDGQLLFFVFTIRTMSNQVAKVLLTPTEDSNDTLIAAIGTLYRAMARKEGIEVQVEVEQI